MWIRQRWRWWTALHGIEKREYRNQDLICLDTNRMYNGKCPVVEVDYSYDKVEVADTFGKFSNNCYQGARRTNAEPMNEWETTVYRLCFVFDSSLSAHQGSQVTNSVEKFFRFIFVAIREFHKKPLQIWMVALIVGIKNPVGFYWYVSVYLEKIK